MPNPTKERIISINQRAYDKLTRAKRESENYSDVVIRLTSTTLEGLQRRGEKEIITSDDRKLSVRVEQDMCMGAMSCVSAAPAVFALDVSQLGLTRKHDEPLGMRDVLEREVDSETLIRAAQSCPYRAIRVIDAETGVEILS